MQTLAPDTEQPSFRSIHPAIAYGLTCLFWVLAIVVLCACGTLGSKPPHATNLTGDWQLNESLSQDPLAQVREQRHDGGGGGMPRQHGPGALGDLVARPQELAIQQTAHELDLKADGSATEFVYGEKVMASLQNGSAERVSGWKGDEFVVRYQVIDGPTATRSYELADSGRQMIVTTQVEGGRA